MALIFFSFVAVQCLCLLETPTGGQIGGPADKLSLCNITLLSKRIDHGGLRLPGRLACARNVRCRAEAGAGLTAARIRTLLGILGKRMDTYFWANPGRRGTFSSDVYLEAPGRKESSDD
jgi:hypothetical protein